MERRMKRAATGMLIMADPADYSPGVFWMGRISAWLAKRTYVDAEGEESQRERVGFVPACRYGGAVPPEKNELGAIVVARGEPRLERGLWVQGVEYIERIFLGKVKA